MKSKSVDRAWERQIMSLKRPSLKPKSSRRGEVGEMYMPFLIVYDPAMGAWGAFWRWDTAKKEERKSSPGYSTGSVTRWALQGATQKLREMCFQQKIKKIKDSVRKCSIK